MDCFISTYLHSEIMMSKITKIWIVLLILTLFAYLFGEQEFVNKSLIILLLVTTFIKGQFVIDYFMNLSEVQLKYRIIPTLWLVTIIIIIGFIYYYPV